MKAIFLGYPKGAKGYRLWLINEKKVVISRDVIFNEMTFFKTNLHAPEQYKETGNFQFEVENDKSYTIPGGNQNDSQSGNLQGSQEMTNDRLIDEADTVLQEDSNMEEQAEADDNKGDEQ